MHVKISELDPGREFRTLASNREGIVLRHAFTDSTHKQKTIHVAFYDPEPFGSEKNVHPDMVVAVV